MNRRFRCFGVLVIVAMGSCVAPVEEARVFRDGPCRVGIAQERTHSEQAAVHRNLGKAYFDNCLDLDRAAEEFQACLEIEPDVAANHVNLAMVYVCSEKYDEALQHLASAEQLDPALLAIAYNRGLVYKRQRKFEEAIGEFKQVLKKDPDCVPCLHMLATCQAELGSATDAIATFERVIELAPLRISAHYTLARLYIRQGNRDRAKLLMQTFSDLQNVVPNTEREEEWLEKSRYTEVIFPPSPVDQEREFTTRFTPDTKRSGVPTYPFVVRESTAGPSIFPLFFDADGDDDLDLLLAGAGTDWGKCLLYRNDGHGKFEEVTATSGIDCSDPANMAVAGDLDNDGDLDLFIGCGGPNRLFRNRGNGTFDDVTEGSGLEGPGHTVHIALFDADHDSDLDLFVCDAGPTEATQTLFLFQNQGTPDPADPLVFREVGGNAGLPLNPGLVTDSCFADWDRNGGIDLYLAIRGRPDLLVSNLRGGRFTDAPGVFPTGPGWSRRVEMGDIDTDGQFDLVGFGPEGLVTFLGSQNGGFRKGTKIRPDRLNFAPMDILLRDFDNSGDMDLLVFGFYPTVRDLPEEPPLLILQARSGGTFEPVRAFPSRFDPPLVRPVSAAVADIDGDCDLDILLTDTAGSLRFLWNDGNGAGNRIPIKLIGSKGNRDGIGSRIEVYAGTFRRAVPVTDTNPHVPIGHRDRVDAFTILWPSGIVQSTTHPDVAPCSVLSVIETPAAIESCPSLYVQTAGGMEYVTDLMGTSALGLVAGPGSYFLPDPREVLKIEGQAPALRDGNLRLVIAQELCEIVYLDSVAVEVCDHPQEITLISDLRFSPGQPPDDRILALRELVHPISARNPRGEELSSSLLARDLISPGGFQRLIPSQFAGLSEPYTLELDFGPATSPSGEPVLIAFGYSEWPAENLSLALLQHGGVALDIPIVEVLGSDARWRKVPGEFAFPALRPKSIAVPLPTWDESQPRRVRISTNLITHWDEIVLGETVPGTPIQATTVRPAKATLGWHGYSRKVDPLSRDFNSTEDKTIWLPIPGTYTAYGDVTVYLTDADDSLAVFGPGEAVTLDLPADRLPPLPEGWGRDYFLVTEGWTKGNSYATGGSGGTPPTPYRAMTQYPFPPGEPGMSRAVGVSQSSRIVSIPTWAEER